MTERHTITSRADPFVNRVLRYYDNSSRRPGRKRVSRDAVAQSARRFAALRVIGRYERRRHGVPMLPPSFRVPSRCPTEPAGGALSDPAFARRVARLLP